MVLPLIKYPEMLIHSFRTLQILLTRTNFTHPIIQHNIHQVLNKLALGYPTTEMLAYVRNRRGCFQCYQH